MNIRISPVSLVLGALITLGRVLRLREMFVAFRASARPLWILDEEVRNAWNGRTACPGNNT